MITPPSLFPGDTISIIAPARKVTPAEIKPAIKTLRQWGFNVITGKNLFKSHHQFSGSDEQRAEDLQTAIDDPAVKAILFARGGYGSIRTAERVDFSALKKNPKWIIGFSDITVFHALLNNAGIETIHGLMAINFNEISAQAAPLNHLKAILNGKEIRYSIPAHGLNRKGTATGILTGGNLSVLLSLRGTPYDINTKGKILFLEDLDEYLYHIDRMMMNLKTGGLLDGLAGLIIGCMSDMKDNKVPFGKTVYRIIAEAVSSCNYPVCFGFPAGHIKNNNPLILGRKVTLSAENKVTLAFECI